MRKLGVAAVAAASVAAGAAGAGTKGGLYDFSYFFGQPHPLSGQQVGIGGGAAPYPPAAPSGGVLYDPYGRTVAQAPARPQAAADAGLLDSGGGFFDRWYVRVGGGYDLPDDLDDNAGGTSVSIDVDDGFMAELAVGRYVGRSFRAELEVAYRQTEIADVSAGGAAVNGSGDYKVLSGMLNGFYDLHLDFPIVPYVGVGIGAAQAELDSVTVGNLTTQSDDSTEFAYQGIVGLSWRFADDFVATVDYRYFGTTGDNESNTMTLSAGLRYDL